MNLSSTFGASTGYLIASLLELNFSVQNRAKQYYVEHCAVNSTITDFIIYGVYLTKSKLTIE